MLFKQAQEVLDGRKRQTRRPVKPWDRAMHIDKNGRVNRYWHPGVSIHRVVNEGYDRDRTRFEVGKTYAVQPGRGQKSIGRIRLLEIRRERLQEISLEDIEAEGITTPEEFARIWGEAITHSWLEVAYERLKKGDLRNAFRYMWRSIYKKPHRWEDNPEVWVLVVEPI